MMNPDFDELVEYVDEQLDKGIGQHVIYAVLKKNGIDSVRIDQVIEEAFQIRNAHAAPSEDVWTKEVVFPSFITNLSLFRYRIGRLEYFTGHLYLAFVTFLYIGVTLLYQQMRYNPGDLQILSDPIYILGLELGIWLSFWFWRFHYLCAVITILMSLVLKTLSSIIVFIAYCLPLGVVIKVQTNMGYLQAIHSIH